MITKRNLPKLEMSQKLKMFREIRGITQEQMGQKINCSSKTISAYENSERDIPLSNINAICETLYISKEYFAFDTHFESVDEMTQRKVVEYLNNNEFKNNIEKLIAMCKQKLEKDGIKFKKEYLPIFDYQTKSFTSYGIFDKSSLPYKDGKIDEVKLEEESTYRYSSSGLCEFKLYDILEKVNGETMELKDLVKCNSLEVFKNTFAKISSRRHFEKNAYNQDMDNTEAYIQSELNYTLENLDPNVSNYWNIIIFLIDNGAYYTKQTGTYFCDVTNFYIVKDVSKTNLVYRHAKDVTSSK